MNEELRDYRHFFPISLTQHFDIHNKKVKMKDHKSSNFNYLPISESTVIRGNSPSTAILIQKTFQLPQIFYFTPSF